MTRFFSYQDLLTAAHQRQTVEKSGCYAVWVWARDGATVQLGLDGHWLKPTHLERGADYSWQVAGEVELDANQAFCLQVQTGQPLNGADKPGLGAVALSSDKGFAPARSYELMRVFPCAPTAVDDQRLAQVKGVNSQMTLRSYTDLAAWQQRATAIRRHILVCLGLWPLPQRRALNARVFDRIQREDYSVEKVFFESWPGFYVCGNLYRPTGQGPFSAIVTPHGHWAEGRLVNNALGSVPGRCINLARQGHIAFSYDMAGYVDSDQVEHRRFGGAREDLWGLGLMGVQLWNSIRAVDFISGLPDVDARRIGCTGASGGGTQTFMLTAVDDRIAAAAPVNMVSAHMQGGCICENQGHLRLDINNVEIAALMAPKPMLLVSTTGDWTVHTPEVEYPAVRQVYQLYGAADKLSVHQEDAPHNYNKGSRQAVYRFFARWLLNSKTPHQFIETPFQPERDADLKVFHNRARPKGAIDAAGLTRHWITERQKRLAALAPKDRAGLKKYGKVMGPALAQALDAGYPTVEELYIRDHGQTRRDGYLIQRLELGRMRQGERLPALLFMPRPRPIAMPATLLVHPQGKAGLADIPRGRPGREVRDLLAAGQMVLAIDPFARGEFQSVFGDWPRPTQDRHFATYNRTDTACRVQDVLTALAYLGQRHDVQSTHLLGLGAAGVWCLLARALAQDVNRTAIDFARFNAAADQAWVDTHFVPAIRSVGDIQTALALIAPGPLLVHQAGRHFPAVWAKACYRLNGHQRDLIVHAGKAGWAKIAAWITQ